MNPVQADVPRFVARDEDVVVSHWGFVGDMVLRVGDRIVTSASEAGPWLLLTARGFGDPMVGTRAGNRLHAEPSGVPVSPARWMVGGSIVAVERDLDRGVLAERSWCVVAKTRSIRGRDQPVQPTEFGGTRLQGHHLDSLCMRAALAPERLGVEVALGAAETLEEAQNLCDHAAWGSIRFAAAGSAANLARGAQMQRAVGSQLRLF